MILLQIILEQQIEILRRESIMSFPFSDEPNVATIICCHVMYGDPVLYASHDDDGMWQFLCGRIHSEEEARIVSLHEAFTLDSSIGALADMPCGYCATRANKNADWIIRKCSN